jgi:hypothetical protein
MPRPRLRLAVLGLALALSGCGPAEQPLPAPVTVKGKVSFQSKPFPGALLQFWRDDDLQARIKPVVAPSDDKGEFTLSVPPGRYKVTVVSSPTRPGGPAQGGAPTGPPSSGPNAGATVPYRYTDKVETPLKVEVPDGGTEQLHLVIEKR